MSGDDLVIRMIDALNALSVPYMLTGSLASNFYGIARSTKDADFVVHLGNTLPSALFAQVAPILTPESQMSFEGVTATHRYILRNPDTEFEIELFLLGDDQYDQQRFRRRVEISLLGRAAFVPTVEDVVITKLLWWKLARRGKDIDDAKDVLAVQGKRLDMVYLRTWCEKHGTFQLFEDALREVQSKL